MNCKNCNDTPYKGIVLCTTQCNKCTFPSSFSLRCCYAQCYWNDDGNNYCKSINFNLVFNEWTAHSYMLLRTRESALASLTILRTDKSYIRHWVDWGCVKFKNVVCMKLHILHCISLSTYLPEWLTDWLIQIKFYEIWLCVRSHLLILLRLRDFASRMVHNCPSP